MASSANNLIVVDGIRRLADIAYLKEMPGFTLVKVSTAPETRYNRLVKRAENTDDQKKTFAEFTTDQKGEADAMTTVVMEKANYEINNDGNLNELYKHIDDLLEKIKN